MKKKELNEFLRRHDAKQRIIEEKEQNAIREFKKSFDYRTYEKRLTSN